MLQIHLAEFVIGFWSNNVSGGGGEKLFSELYVYLSIINLNCSTSNRMDISA